MHKKTLFWVGILTIGIALIYWYGGSSTLFALLKHRHQTLRLVTLHKPLSSRFIYFLIYFVATACALPGVVVLTIAGGSLFGMRDGFILTALAATAGATLIFLITRTFGKRIVEKRYPDQIQKLNSMLHNEGILYLLTLRLIPMVPFFLVNLLCGITNIPITHYIIISFIGMIPGIVLYTYAGTLFASINSPSELLSATVIGIFVLLAFIPYLLVHIIRSYSKKYTQRGQL